MKHKKTRKKYYQNCYFWVVFDGKIVYIFSALLKVLYWVYITILIFKVTKKILGEKCVNEELTAQN